MSPTTLLYIPADQPSMLEKARQRGADAVIIDLEDAVAMAGKVAARQAAKDFIAEPPVGDGAIYVRVNGDENLAADVEAVAHPNLSAVVIAKARHAAQVETADRILLAAEESHGMSQGSIELSCLIETADGLRKAYELASHPRVARLGLGEADLGADLGIDHAAPDDIWDPIRLRVVVDSAAAGIGAPAAPVSINYKELDALCESTSHLADLGFGSRAAIHPAQISAIKQGFQPSDAAIETATSLLASYESSHARGEAVFTDDQGRMVDEAVVRHARRIIARSTIEGSA